MIKSSDNGSLLFNKTNNNVRLGEKGMKMDSYKFDYMIDDM